MKYSLLFLYIFLMTGCAIEKKDVRTTGFEDQSKSVADYSSGSIWQSSSASMTDDLKARRRGDIVTIVISENASASKEANTATSRNSAMSAGITNLVGIQKNQEVSKYLGDLKNLITAENASKFAGSGSTSRLEKLQATITARVVDVLPNGNLLIEGRRNVKVNDEDQEIILEGTVRARDIAPDNTINSIYIADAKITYSGRGIISDRQSPGWLMNIIEKIWPF